MASLEKLVGENAITELVNKLNAKFASIGSAYQFKGDVASVAALPALTGVEEGWVYNLQAAGTSTADFREGAGKTIPEGANIACGSRTGTTYIAVTPEGTENPSTEGWYEFDGTSYALSTDTTADSSKTYYKAEQTTGKCWDVLSGFVDLSPYQTKTLDTALTVDDTSVATVEEALGALNTKKLNTSDVVFMTAAEVDALFE